MNKPGDIVMVFGNPIKKEHPIDQAKLIEKKQDLPNNKEQWWVEYLNDPDHQYLAIIEKEKDNGEDKT